MGALARTGPPRPRPGIRWNTVAEAEWARFVAPLLLLVGAEMYYRRMEYVLKPHAPGAEASRADGRGRCKRWAFYAEKDEVKMVNVSQYEGDPAGDGYPEITLPATMIKAITQA